MTMIRELYDAADKEEVEEIRRQMPFEALSDEEQEEGDNDEEEETTMTTTDDESSPTVVSESTSALTEPSSLSNLDDEGAKLIPFAELKHFVESSCCCVSCHAKIELTQETWDLATNLCITGDSQKEADGH